MENKAFEEGIGGIKKEEYEGKEIKNSLHFVR